MAIRCPSCSEQNLEGARFCGRCGAILEAQASTSHKGKDPLLGRVIANRYRIDRTIGEGGMGRVYFAAQQLGTATRAVAVKVLHAVHSRDPTLRQRFYQECELVVQLTHPNTIQFYDFGELEDGRLYIVMECIEGHSLAQAIAQGPMALPRVERALSQIAGSLGEAHARGIVHRDLKPDNILLTTRGGEVDFVKVCDFGIAKRVEGSDEGKHLTLQGTLIGTPQYMSPEQLTGGDVDARSDIYSLGLIVFEMLTGQRPFHASTPMEWAAKHATAEPPSLDLFPTTRDLPADKKRALMRALSKLPRDRQQTARQLAAEFLGRSDASTPISIGPVVAPTIVSTPALGPVDGTAPTMHATPQSMQMALSNASSAPMLPPVKEGGGALVTAAWVFAVLGLLIAVGGGTVFAFRDRIWPEPEEETPPAFPDAGRIALDAGFDGGPLIANSWIRIVREVDRVEDPANALGPNDNEYAIIRPNGFMELETAAGTRIEADGGPGPDLWINADDVRTGPFRVEVRTRQYPYRAVGPPGELNGSMAIDVDPHGVERIRYVRISNHGGRNVYIDSVGAHRVIVVNEARCRAAGTCPQ